MDDRQLFAHTAMIALLQGYFSYVTALDPTTIEAARPRIAKTELKPTNTARVHRALLVKVKRGGTMPV